MARAETIVAVLAGGRGERLGGGKAAAALGGRPLISHPLRAAAQAGLDAIVVAKPDSALPPIKQPIVCEPPEPVHPLCGVIAALRFAASRELEAVVVVACDMPFITPELLAWLATLEGPVIARLAGRTQPLPARCPVGARAALARALASHSSLVKALSALAPRVLGERELARFGDPLRLGFNVNDGADLRVAAEWLAPARG